MTFSRYRKRKKIINKSEEYRQFMENKDIKQINHYESPSNILDKEKQNFAHEKYIWKPGDKLYKLSQFFYGDSKLWWIIAKINKKPTDHDYAVGEEIIIPDKNFLEDVIKYLGY